MNKKRIGKQTIRLENDVYIISAACIAGKKEGEGPLSNYFDTVLSDDLFGEETWEKAESKLVKETFALAAKKANKKIKDMDYCITGDLQNQESASTFGVRDFDIPFLGIYGACSTMGEAMGLGAMLIDGGFANYIIAGASSHFCVAEKQFRFPLGLGTQRPQTSTWTVTGDGAVVLSSKGEGPRITEIITGKIVDLGITDANNMGAAMAPAAADLIVAHMNDTGRKPSYYDVIATGDLGYIGHKLTVKLAAEKGINLGDEYTDCGKIIFDKETQDTHSGGSGCACSALTFCSYFYKKLCAGEIQRMLFVPTGALMSQTTSQQGESIPGIAHGVVIESGRRA